MRALDEHRIPYFITGSVASSVHGEYRATNDVDIVANLSPANVGSLLAELQGTFVADAEQARTAVASGTSFNLIDRGTFLEVDVFPSTTEFERQAQQRAESIVPPGGTRALRVATVEDILLAKLRWYRLGGEASEVQQRDIRGIIALNRGALDLEHLKRWSVALGIVDLTERFLAD
ncbi:MAG TPA: hypothetical protein VFK13_04830 [Gemmatimonadaceae bacterium]|nr:hypothetical protein [Gemmatimonadaceae bacterium]